VKLAQAGCDLSVVARGATLQALQQGGLRLQPQGGEAASVKVRTSASPADLGVQDLVIVSVKAPAMAEVASAIAPLLGPRTVVLTAMNACPGGSSKVSAGRYAGTRLKSVDADGSIARAVPASHIIGCVVHASFSLDGPGQVRQHFGNKLIIGEPSGEKTPGCASWRRFWTGPAWKAVLSDRSRRTSGSSSGAT
jgi:2-dehydropantoate 2-reductase